MNEIEWRNAADPAGMLAFRDGQMSERKLRLFACACCRRIWDLLTDERSRHAVNVAQKFADGLLPARKLRAAERAALSASKETADAYWDEGTDEGWQRWTAAAAAAWVAAVEADWPLETAVAAADARAGQWRPAWVKKGEQRAQCDLLRDLVGNPFQAVVLDPDWLRRAGGTVAKIAHAIYQKGRFNDLPILGDALMEARCDNPEALSHCRAPTEHVQGCWLVDLLLEH
jgi:hypothetical protein